jgi:ParB-like chromosome segregation protein Spo0J
VSAVIAKIESQLQELQGEELITEINAMREMIHRYSPFQNEPVDFVRWVRSDLVHANDYNPNSVAPPEMELLRLSIDADGYTQPIVSMPDPDGRFEVIDGFHRHRVGKECADIQARVQGYLPLVTIRETQSDKTDRMASTIRHNRARGKHRVEAMSEIVIELKKRNWSDEKIAKNLGMEPDEVLRLCQISGIADLFADEEFSASWDIEDFDEADIELEAAE